jgi:4-hydroxy-3-polyprenylbenzoate decarboxylase
MVITRDPDKGTRNVGCYRMQVYDKRTTGMHWQLHKTGRRHMRRYKELGQQRMPVAVALGGDPVLPYAATAPLPDGIDEFLFAGFLRRKPVEMVRCKTNDLEVPGVGGLRAGRLRRRRRAAPRGAVRRSHRLLLAGRRLPGLPHHGDHAPRDPIYATTVVGPPPQEDAWLGKATERLFLPLLADDVPRDRRHEPADRGRVPQPLHRLDQEGVPAPRAQDLPFAVGMGQMMFAKCIVVVDDDVNVQNVREVAWRALNNIDAKRDVFFAEGRSTCWITRRRRSASAASWAWTPRASGRKRASRASGRTS